MKDQNAVEDASSEVDFMHGGVLLCSSFCLWSSSAALWSSKAVDGLSRLQFGSVTSLAVAAVF